MAAKESTIERDNLVVVGLEVSTYCPGRASGSAKPLTIKRAFARGDPSGFLAACQSASRVRFFGRFKDPDMVVEEALQLFHLGFLEHGPLMWA